MRITNKMMTNNMLGNINKNKVNMSALEEQYATGKKIQKPSDDPIVTVRALKLRTNLSELEQYYEKNIPDAKSWMDVTESALTTVNEILSSVNTYCVQGSSDTLTAQDRSSIVENLEQMKQQIYQEGNTNYAGRYVFTGYKTDSSLIFTEEMPNLTYTITEDFANTDIQTVNKVSGSYALADYDNAAETFAASPVMNNVYRLQLSYDKLSTTPPDGISVYKKNASGVLEEVAGLDSTKIVTKSVTDDTAYQPAAGYANFIPETGEIIFSSDAYEVVRTADKVQLSYAKTGFTSGELKPEHYFTCDMYDSTKPEQGTITYTKSNQEIQYEVNYNQKLTINTQGSDSITHRMGRRIDDILTAVNDVITTEDKIAEVKKRLENTNLTETEISRYNALMGQLDTELELKKETMQQSFAKGITVSQEEQDRVNEAVADLGSRYVRLELTENRLSNQKVDFTELMSNNEDADIAETIVKYGAAEAIYNASLSAASKVIQNTLLDFL